MTQGTTSTSLIQDLIRSCVARYQHLMAAAEALTDPMLSNEFMGYSLQWQRFARDLSIRLLAFDRQSLGTSDGIGTFNFNSIDRPAALNENTIEGILGGCEDGESTAMDSYRKAMDADLPVEYSVLIESQYEALQDTYERIRLLRHAAAICPDALPLACRTAG